MATPALNQSNCTLSNLLISITHSQHHHAPVHFLELKCFCTTFTFTWFYMHREKPCTKFVMISLFFLFICNSSSHRDERSTSGKLKKQLFSCFCLWEGKMSIFDVLFDKRCKSEKTLPQQNSMLRYSVWTQTCWKWLIDNTSVRQTIAICYNGSVKTAACPERELCRRPRISSDTSRGALPYLYAIFFSPLIASSSTAPAHKCNSTPKHL